MRPAYFAEAKPKVVLRTGSVCRSSFRSNSREMNYENLDGRKPKVNGR